MQAEARDFLPDAAGHADPHRLVERDEHVGLRRLRQVDVVAPLVGSRRRQVLARRTDDARDARARQRDSATLGCNEID